MGKLVDEDEVFDYIIENEVADINISSLKAVFKNVASVEKKTLPCDVGDEWLLKLPCKIGDSVYRFCEDFGRVLEYTISSIYVYAFASGGIDIIISGGACYNDDCLDDFEVCLEEFKKEFFKTPYEAEEAYKASEA
jgi:hypothetical protein